MVPSSAHAREPTQTLERRTTHDQVNRGGVADAAGAIPRRVHGRDDQDRAAQLAHIAQLLRSGGQPLPGRKFFCSVVDGSGRRDY